MSTHTNFGNIMGTQAEIHFLWKIPNFTTIVEDENFGYCESPAFRFGYIPCYIQLHRKTSTKPECMMLCLSSDNGGKLTAEYTLGLKRVDGNVEQLFRGILRREPEHSVPRVCIGCCFIKRSDVLRRRDELAPADVLTVTCTLKWSAILSSKRKVLDNAKPKKLIRLDKLSENFKDLFGDKESCDLMLKVKDKYIKVHRRVLMARSSVFAAAFKQETLEKQTRVITIPDCDPDAFQKFLEYLYCGRLDEVSLHTALNLYHISDKYDIGELKSFCMENMVRSLTIENICEVAVFADEYDDTQLFTSVQNFFNNNLCKILETSHWESLMQKEYRLANKLLKKMVNVKSKE